MPSFFSDNVAKLLKITDKTVEKIGLVAEKLEDYSTNCCRAVLKALWPGCWDSCSFIVWNDMECNKEIQNLILMTAIFRSKTCSISMKIILSNSYKILLPGFHESINEIIKTTITQWKHFNLKGRTFVNNMQKYT